MDITATDKYVKFGSKRIPKGTASYTPYVGGYVLMHLTITGESPFSVPIEGNTINGAPITELSELTDFLDANLFKSGGGTGEGVQGITGDLVDNTDPSNPVINNPDWDDVEGKPTTFPPSAHTHPIGQVVDLQDELDAKLTATQGVAVPDATAAPTMEEYNSLLASLRDAGIIAT